MTRLKHKEVNVLQAFETRALQLAPTLDSKELTLTMVDRVY